MNGRHDAQQVCENGHQITSRYHEYPQHRRDFCSKCGAKTIHKCPTCDADIEGKYDVPGFLDISVPPVPRFCKSCGSKFPWSDLLSSDQNGAISPPPAETLRIVCHRLPLLVRQLRHRHDDRSTLDVQDEYDLQDLLHSVLLLFFDDVRPEEYTPSYAAKATRMDFLLKGESVAIEVKMTRAGLGSKEVSDQLVLDIARYRGHPSCKHLVCLVYDPEHRVSNPRGIEKDLNALGEGIKVDVYIVPRDG